MLTVHSFTFNPLQENTYLLINEQKECWIIDPGMSDPSEHKQFTAFLENQQLTPTKIINTHAHIDHILGVNTLKQKYGLPFGLHKKDLPVLSGAAGSALLFGLPLDAVPSVDFFIEENSRLVFGDQELAVRFTPGHSPGSVIFYCKEDGFVIGGDVLFQGSVGRADLPGGDFDLLAKSIRSQLYTLPDNTVVYPGHGPTTTIGTEKRTNPFVAGQ